MGRQSARLWYRGKDHKDIYFQGNYHKAMYLGGNLLWQKLSGDFSVTKIVDGALDAWGSLNNQYVYFLVKTNDIYFIKRIELSTRNVVQITRLGDDESYEYDHHFGAANGIGILADRISSHGTFDARDYIISAMIYVYDLDSFAPATSVFGTVSAVEGYDFGYHFENLIPQRGYNHGGFRVNDSLKLAGFYNPRTYSGNRYCGLVLTYSLTDGVTGNQKIKGIKHSGDSNFQEYRPYTGSTMNDPVMDVGFSDNGLEYGTTTRNTSRTIDCYNLVRIPDDVPNTDLERNDPAFEYSNYRPVFGSTPKRYARGYQESIYKSKTVCVEGSDNKLYVTDVSYNAPSSHWWELVNNDTVVDTAAFDMSPDGNLFVYATDTITEYQSYEYYLYDRSLDKKIRLPDNRGYIFAGDRCLLGSDGLYKITYG